MRNLYKYIKIYADAEPVLFEDDVFRAEIPVDCIGANTDEQQENNKKTARKFLLIF